MPIVRFTANIQRHVPCPPREVGGTTVGEALEQYFVGNVRARDYVLDDQGKLRQHMAAFVEGRQLQDRDALSDAVGPADTIDVVQALSGG